MGPIYTYLLVDSSGSGMRTLLAYKVKSMSPSRRESQTKERWSI